MLVNILNGDCIRSAIEKIKLSCVWYGERTHYQDSEDLQAYEKMISGCISSCRGSVNHDTHSDD